MLISLLIYRLEASAGAAIISVRLRLPPRGRWLPPVAFGRIAREIVVWTVQAL
jgi:hypothetical protein